MLYCFVFYSILPIVSIIVRIIVKMITVAAIKSAFSEVLIVLVLVGGVLIVIILVLIVQ